MIVQRWCNRWRLGGAVTIALLGLLVLFVLARQAQAQDPPRDRDRQAQPPAWEDNEDPPGPPERGRGAGGPPQFRDRGRDGTQMPARPPRGRDDAWDDDGPSSGSNAGPAGPPQRGPAADATASPPWAGSRNRVDHSSMAGSAALAPMVRPRVRSRRVAMRAGRASSVRARGPQAGPGGPPHDGPQFDGRQRGPGPDAWAKGPKPPRRHDGRQGEFGPPRGPQAGPGGPPPGGPQFDGPQRGPGPDAWAKGPKPPRRHDGRQGEFGRTRAQAGWRSASGWTAVRWPAARSWPRCWAKGPKRHAHEEEGSWPAAWPAGRSWWSASRWTAVRRTAAWSWLRWSPDALGPAGRVKAGSTRRWSCHRLPATCVSWQPAHPTRRLPSFLFLKEIKTWNDDFLFMPTKSLKGFTQ